MKVCIDLRPTQNEHASRGIGALVRNLVRETGRENNRQERIFLVDRGGELPGFSGDRRRIACYRLPRLHQLNWMLNQLLLPRLLRRHNIDLFVATDFQSYIIPPAGVKQIGLAYDLIPFIFPETMAEQPFLTQWGWRFNFRNLRRCSGIIAISESTKQDLVKFLGLPEDTIRVVYPGIDHSLFNIRNAEQRIPSRYGIAGDYLLYVGDTEWRKNLRGLLEALAEIPGDMKLVIAGKRAPTDPRLKKWLMETKTADRVILPGFIPDEDLPSLYGHARIFIFPTRYEGFGLPVVEAMACGCPVITSHNSSLPEVAGNAALYVDPERPENIATGVVRLLDNEILYNGMRSQGLVQARQFTWKGFARGVQDVLSEIDVVDTSAR